MVIALAAITAPFATVTVPLPESPIVRVPEFDKRELEPSTRTVLLVEVLAEPTMILPEAMTLPPDRMFSVFPAPASPKVTAFAFQSAPAPTIVMLLLEDEEVLPTPTFPLVKVEEAVTVSEFAPRKPTSKASTVILPPLVTSKAAPSSMTVAEALLTTPLTAVRPP